MATSAHAINDEADFRNPNVVKVVTDQAQRALYFSRAPIPWWRDGAKAGQAALPPFPALRHIGLYAYRAATLRRFPSLPPAPMEQVEALEQLRFLWQGERIAVHITAHVPQGGHPRRSGPRAAAFHRVSTAACIPSPSGSRRAVRAMLK